MNRRLKSPEDDRRVIDAERFIDQQRREAMAMIALWERSRKPYAAEELRYWRRELGRIDRDAARMAQKAERQPDRSDSLDRSQNTDT
jgi:hypothetical protein